MLLNDKIKITYKYKVFILITDWCHIKKNSFIIELGTDENI